MAVSLTDLEAGHSFAVTSFVVSPGQARAYRDATSDTQATAYAAAGDAVPPLAMAALALGALLREVTLPPGSLHASESVEFHAPIREGSSVECRARLAQRSVRAGYVWSVIETDLSAAGTLAVSARATVLSPVAP